MTWENMTTFNCPDCNTEYPYTDELTGQKCQCVNCETKFMGPDMSQSSAAQGTPQKSSPVKIFAIVGSVVLAVLMSGVVGFVNRDDSTEAESDNAAETVLQEDNKAFAVMKETESALVVVEEGVAASAASPAATGSYTTPEIQASHKAGYLSPFDIDVFDNGKKLLVTERTGMRLDIIDVKTDKVVGIIDFMGDS